MNSWINLAWEKAFSRDLRYQEALKKNRGSLGRYICNTYDRQRINLQSPTNLWKTNNLI